MVLRDLRKAQVRGKRVLVRVDYNINAINAKVHANAANGGRLRDLVRIDATLPTLRWLLRHGASVIIVSHRGRPKGRQRGLSLRPCVQPLSRILKHQVRFIDSSVFSKKTSDALVVLKPGQVVMLENIRFESGEEKNDLRLAKRLASFADMAVNDAFADSHRAHASIVGLAQYVPMYAGLLLQEEYSYLSQLMNNPPRPFIAIIGGAKISTKLGLVERLLKKTDAVLLGGALANTVLQAEGLAIGKSVTEPGMLRAAHGLTVRNPHLKIPVDVVVTVNPSTRAKRSVRAVGNVQAHEKILDIGPSTVDLFSRVIATAKTIVWNGPMGLYEISPFDRGTKAIARAIGKRRARSIAGGGETIDAIRSVGATKNFTFLSTGGGAMLEFLEGKTLPGLKAVAKR